MNQSLADMTGYDVDDFCSHYATDFVHPADAPEMWEQYAQRVRGDCDHFRAEKRYVARTARSSGQI